jgi:hypothetical protein
MSMQDSHEIRWGRQAWYLALVGASDLPTTGGAWQVGDRVVNWTPTIGSPSEWICVTASPNPAFVPAGGLIGSGAGTVNTVGAATTLSPTISLVEVTTASAITLPSTYPTGARLVIMTDNVTATVTPASGVVIGSTGTFGAQATAGATVAAVTITAYSHAELMSNGTNWYVV